MYVSILAKHIIIHYFIGSKSSSLTSREFHAGAREEGGRIFGAKWEVLTVKRCPTTYLYKHTGEAEM